MTPKIALIGAMDDEIKAYRAALHNVKITKYKIFTFYEGVLFGKPVVVVKSGVGKTFAAMVCQHLIDKFNVGGVIFTGVGGSLNKSLRIGDVLIGKDSAYHDFDVTPLGFKRGQISYTDYRFFPCDKQMVKLALKTPLTNHKIITGRILTGDQFFTLAERQEHRYLTEELKGDCIEMEGAAVGQVCHINEVPHLIIRTVSDQADGKAVEDYNRFTPIVAANSLKIVEYVLKNI